LLSQEQVGSFDNILEVGLALRVDELADVGDVDGFGTVEIVSSNHAFKWKPIPSTARDEDVGLEAQVGAIPEVNAIRNQFSSYKDKSITKSIRG
jgi:hypothetical protein